MLTQKRILELRTLPYEKYLKTPEWKQKRDAALERDGYRCRACDSDKKLEVHHRTYVRRGNEDLNDLTTLCESCHEHFHEKMSQDEIMERTYSEPHVPVSKEEQAQKWEDYLIGALIQNQDLYPHVCGLLSEDDFTSPDARALYSLLGSASSSGLPLELIPSNLKDAVVRVIGLVNSRFPDKAVLDAKTVIGMVSRMEQLAMSRKHEELSLLIREAVIAGDKVTERQLRQQVIENKMRRRLLY